MDTTAYTDGIHAGVEERKQRGLAIAALARIEQVDGYYVVPSQSQPKRYKVDMYPAMPTCNCPDFETRGCKCKHMYAVEFTLQRERLVIRRLEESAMADPALQKRLPRLREAAMYDVDSAEKPPN
jgi:hypothetical protein